MVIRDIGLQNLKEHQTKNSRHFLGIQGSEIINHIASPGDRLLACFLDFLILGPFVGLFTAVYLRDLRSYVYYETEGTEAVVTLILMAFVGILVISLTQSLFLALTGATPGQRFLYLRVVGYAPFAGNPITFSQAFARSLSWWFGAIFLFVPLLEILSHPLRRTFYDRISDTIVVCLKKTNSRPHPNETHLIVSWLQMFGIGFLGVFAMYLHNLEERTLQGHWAFVKAQKGGMTCEAIDPELRDIPKRLDQALSMYWIAKAAGQQTSDDGENHLVKAKTCLEKEADFALWQRQKTFHPLAYLAKSILNEKGAAKLSNTQASNTQTSNTQKIEEWPYENLICVNQTSEECALNHYFQNRTSGSEELLRKSGLRYNVSRVLLMQESIKQKNYTSALVLMEDLLANPEISPHVSNSYIRLIWQIQTHLSADSARQKSNSVDREPASDESNLEQLKAAVLSFKEKYQIE